MRWHCSAGQSLLALDSLKYNALDKHQAERITSFHQSVRVLNCNCLVANLMPIVDIICCCVLGKDT